MNFDEIVEGKQIVNIGQEVVVIDPSKLVFNEASLSNFVETEAVWYDYFGRKLADAELLLQSSEMQYESAYASKFIQFKEDGGSDKLVESLVKADADMNKLRENIISAKYKVKTLQQHLRAWDKSHENSQSLGFRLNKEMDKLNNSIYKKSNSNEMNEKLDEIFGTNE